MKRLIPIFDDSAAFSCTISPDEIPGRLATIERMRTDLTRLERTDHGLLLHFPPRDDLERGLRQFAAGELVDRLEAFFTGDEPATSLAALL